MALDFWSPVSLHPSEAGQYRTHVTVDIERADDGGTEGYEAAEAVEAAAAAAAAVRREGEVARQREPQTLIHREEGWRIIRCK